MIHVLDLRSRENVSVVFPNDHSNSVCFDVPFLDVILMR